MKVDIVIITGTAGAGKTTVAETLCHKLNKSMHIQVDSLRHMIKAGYVSPKNWNNKVSKQYRLARKNAAAIAINSAREGFFIAIDDIVRRKWVKEWKKNLSGFKIKFILLSPQVDKAKKRNIDRKIWTVPEDIVKSLHETLSRENTEKGGWIIVDNTDQTVDQTVEEIRERISK